MDDRPRLGALEWLTARNRVRAARAAITHRSARFLELTRRARLAAELGGRVLEPVDPLREGSGTALAIDLYRQSSYWSLCALVAETELPTPERLWQAALPSTLERLAPDPDTRATLEKLFVATSFIELGELDEGPRARLASDARLLADGLLESLETPERTLKRLRFKRLVRVLATVLIVGAGAYQAEVRIQQWRLGPNLLHGKPWKQSSVWARCDVKEHRCGPLHGDIFFHTQDDDTPWVEFDFKQPTRFSKLFVRNRNELQDRAVPLALEISRDDKVWKEVVRRTETFRDWSAKFAPKTARYVRLRTLRKSYLHLEQFKLYR